LSEKRLSASSLLACWQSAGSGDTAMPQELKITLRLYPGPDDELIVWLNGLNLPYGKKGEAIKDALRRGLGQSATTNPATLDAGSLLADIRQVIEASIQTSLAGLAVNPPAANETDQTEQVEDRLSRLDRDLTLNDGSHW